MKAKSTESGLRHFPTFGDEPAGFPHDEIGSVRDEMRAEIRLVRGEIGSLRDQVQDNRAALARIEAMLDERLPQHVRVT